MPNPGSIISYSELPGITSIHHDFKFPVRDSKDKLQSKEKGKQKSKDEEITTGSNLGSEKRVENRRSRSNQGSATGNMTKTASNSGSSKELGTKKSPVSLPTSRTNSLPSSNDQTDASSRNGSNQVISSKQSKLNEVFGSTGGDLKKKLSQYSIRQISRSQRFLAKQLSSKSLHEDMIGMKILPEEAEKEEEFEHVFYPTIPIGSRLPRSLPPPLPLSQSGLDSEVVSERTELIESPLPVSSSSSGKKIRKENSIPSSKSSSQPTRNLSEVTPSTTPDYNTSVQSSTLKDRNRKKKREENLLVILKRFDTVFLIDDSVSMSKGNMWKETREVLEAVASKAIRYGSDGVDVCFLNSSKNLKNSRSWKEVEELFQSVKPIGRSSPTEYKIENLLSEYLDLLEYNKCNKLPIPKPINLIVISDGSTDDIHTLISIITSVTNRLEESKSPSTQIGIQFVQIGHNSEATEFLKILDDDLKSVYGIKRDIVDTIQYKGDCSNEFILKTLLGGINRRIDLQEG